MDLNTVDANYKDMLVPSSCHVDYIEASYNEKQSKEVVRRKKLSIE